eukprot:2672170-Karenia_brevis.AAC.1
MRLAWVRPSLGDGGGSRILWLSKAPYPHATLPKAFLESQLKNLNIAFCDFKTDILEKIDARRGATQ